MKVPTTVKQFGWIVGALALATLVGCGGGDGIVRLPVHPVEGQITRNGKPLANALVALHPKGGDSRAITARGQTDENGNFKVTTYDQNDGAPEGDYAVTVQYYQLVKTGSSAEPGPNVLNPKISSPNQTDIVVKIAAGPNKLSPIEVERK